MRLLLVENEFSELSSFLNTHGYGVERTSASSFFDMLKVRQDFNFIVLYMEECDKETASLIISYCLNNSLCFVIVSSVFTDELASWLKEHGVARFVTVDEIFRNSQIFRFVSAYDDIEQLRIVHLGSDLASHRIIESISNSYGVYYIWVNDEKSLIDNVDCSTDMVLLDLGCVDFDTQHFLHKALYNRDFLKTICVPFSFNGDISITDINCGLNRLAKVFLNLDELLGFLARYYHERELVCAMHALKEFVQKYCEDGCLSKSSLQVYHEKGDSFFEHFLPDDDYFEGMRERSQRLNAVGYKSSMFRWLLSGWSRGKNGSQNVYMQIRD
ncbi:MAG: hypothetical protein JXK07_06155 [Spirochaetes bacterium]|nr:hypothetical protein [Spirochaetota bacterium]MBN2772352.1 hypothetical protein [Spirochaetota bacterium]